MINNQICGIKTSSLQSFTENNIYSNTSYDCYYTSTIDQIAINNYWGTTNKSEIDAQIYDYWDEITHGKIIYEPYATKPFQIGPTPLEPKAMPWIPLLLLDD